MQAKNNKLSSDIKTLIDYISSGQPLTIEMFQLEVLKEKTNKKTKSVHENEPKLIETKCCGGNFFK
jgi:hypothetical protein